MTYESNRDIFCRCESPQIRVTFDTLVFLDLVIMGWIITMKDLEAKKRRMSAAEDLENSGSR